MGNDADGRPHAIVGKARGKPRRTSGGTDGSSRDQNHTWIPISCAFCITYHPPWAALNGAPYVSGCVKFTPQPWLKFTEVSQTSDVGVLGRAKCQESIARYVSQEADPISGRNCVMLQ